MTFEEFYAEHFRVAWRALLALGVPDRDLADVTQEVFMQVHRRFSQFDQGSGGAAWLRAFCVNASRNWHRMGRNRLETSDGGEKANLVRDHAPDPEEDASRRDGMRLLRRALDALPQPQREVFVLFELEQMGAPDIAALLKIPLGTCYSRLRLGREAFRAALEPPERLARDG